MLKLAAITGRQDFKAAAEKTLYFCARRLYSAAQAVPHLLLALAFYLEEPNRAVIQGDAKLATTRALLHTVHSVLLPNKVVLGTSGPVDPTAKALPAEAAPTLFLCTGTACQPPTCDPETIKRLLSASAHS